MVHPCCWLLHSVSLGLISSLLCLWDRRSDAIKGRVAVKPHVTIMPMQESSTSESDDGSGDSASADGDIFATVVPGGDNGGGLALDPGAAHSNEPMPPLPAEAVPGGDGHPREQPVVVPPPPPAPLPPVPLSVARASAAGSQAGDFGPREEAEATVSFAEGKITFYRKGTRFQAQCFIHGPYCRGPASRPQLDRADEVKADPWV